MSPRNRKPVPCPKCGLPVTYYGALGEWWCGSAGCQTRASAPPGAERALAGDGGREEHHQLGPLATSERHQERSEGPSAPAEPVLVTVSDVERQEVSWLWPGYIPRGRLTIIDGDPGVGKSWLALAIGTAITLGRVLPGQESTGEPEKILLLTAEDAIADTIRPRLEDMGADLQGVTVLTAVRDKEGSEHHVSLVTDLAAVDTALSSGGYGLVIIDPINAYLGIALDTHRDAALRSVLTPLAQLAERWGVAIVCIRHLTKSGRDKAIYRGQGNIAYTAAARVVHLVGVNPDDPQERVLICIKNNLVLEPPALAFELTEGRFLWRGETSVTAAALLRPESDDGEGSALAEAEEFLRVLLADGSVDAEDGWRQARKLNIAERTLKRARAVLGVKARREGFGPNGRWLWEASPVEAHRGPKPHTIETWPPMEAPGTEGGCEGKDLAPYGVAIPAPVEALTDYGDRPPGAAPAPIASTPAPVDDGRRKLAFDLWEGVGCCPIRWKPGQVIFDLRRWLPKATDEEVAQVVELLEAMPVAKGEGE